MEKYFFYLQLMGESKCGPTVMLMVLGYNNRMVVTLVAQHIHKITTMITGDPWA